jgi:hypothetical protein
MRHRKRLARAGDPEQHLVALAARQPLAQLVDRLRLIPGRLELGAKAERSFDIALRAFGDEQWQHDG